MQKINSMCKMSNYSKHPHAKKLPVCTFLLMLMSEDVFMECVSQQCHWYVMFPLCNSRCWILEYLEGKKFHKLTCWNMDPITVRPVLLQMFVKGRLAWLGARF